ncbi:MAG: NAD(P)H-quinone oxidoreductase [Acidimicrobiales bacterium]
MRAAVITQHGEPEVLEIQDIPAPQPGPEEVLVDVAASALNRADLLQRMGLYPGPPADFDVPGLEFSGLVAALGSQTTRWAIGDRVMGITSGAAHAEQLVTHQDLAMEVPPEMSLLTAGALPEVFITAWDALVLQGGLQAGQTALVHAGASGVGTAAIQICRYLGAKVVVTASGPKVGRCTELGADLAIDYTSQDWVAEVKAFTEGQGANVVLDVIGGDYLEKNVRSLATKGTIVQVGVMGGGKATFSLGMLLPKRAILRGTVLRGRSTEEKIAVSQAFSEQILPGFINGALEVVVDRRFSLDAIAEAHAYMASNANVGKIVLEISPEGVN